MHQSVGSGVTGPLTGLGSHLPALDAVLGMLHTRPSALTAITYRDRAVEMRCKISRAIISCTPNLCSLSFERAGTRKQILVTPGYFASHMTYLDYKFANG